MVFGKQLLVFYPTDKDLFVALVRCLSAKHRVKYFNPPRLPSIFYDNYKTPSVPSTSLRIYDQFSTTSHLGSSLLDLRRQTAVSLDPHSTLANGRIPTLHSITPSDYKICLFLVLLSSFIQSAMAKRCALITISTLRYLHGGFFLWRVRRR